MAKPTHIIILEIDGNEFFASKENGVITPIKKLPGALAYDDITDAVIEIQRNFRDTYRGDVYLEAIELEAYYSIDDQNRIIFNESIYKALNHHEH